MKWLNTCNFPVLLQTIHSIRETVIIHHRKLAWVTDWHRAKRPAFYWSIFLFLSRGNTLSFQRIKAIMFNTVRRSASCCRNHGECWVKDPLLVTVGRCVIVKWTRWVYNRDNFDNVKLSNFFLIVGFVIVMAAKAKKLSISINIIWKSSYIGSNSSKCIEGLGKCVVS